MTKILIVDDHSSVRTQLRETLDGFPEPIFEADSGASALSTLSQHRGPWIVLLDWIIPAPDGCAVCRLVRSQHTLLPPYVILMSSKAGRVDVAHAIRAGADEFLPKPIAPDLLRSRVRAARRRVAGDKTPSRIVLDGLREGVREGDGELIVRDEDVVWRVHFHRGQVCWVAVSDDLDSFTQALSADGLVTEEIRAAAVEARQTGEGFYDVLIRWGLMDPERLRHVSLQWTRRRVQALMRTHNPRVLFVPWKRRADLRGLSFELEELVTPETIAAADAEGHQSVLPPPGDRAAWSRAFFHVERVSEQIALRLDAAMTQPGAVCCAVIERDTGRCEGWRGEPVDPGAVWAHLQALNALVAQGDEVEDLVMSTVQHLHLLRRIEGEATPLIFYLVVKRSEGSLGMARATLASLCRDDQSERVLAEK